MGIEPVTTRWLVEVLTTKLLGRVSHGNDDDDELVDPRPERESPALLVVWAYQQKQLFFGRGQFFFARKCFFRRVFVLFGGVFVLWVFFSFVRAPARFFFGS